MNSLTSPSSLSYLLPVWPAPDRRQKAGNPGQCWCWRSVCRGTECVWRTGGCGVEPCVGPTTLNFLPPPLQGGQALPFYCALIHWILPQCEVGTIITLPISQTRELRYREVEWLGQGHTASRWQTEDLNPGSLASGTVLFTHTRGRLSLLRDLK